MRSQADAAGGGPVLEPVDGPLELGADFGRDERDIGQVGLHLVLPLGIGVRQEPLVVEDLDEDAARTPADHGPGVELVHHGRTVLGTEELAHRVPRLADGRAAEAFVEPSLRELGAVDLLGQRVHARVVLVRDLRTLDRVLRRALAPALDRDQGPRNELRVPTLLLEVAERDVVERRVRGDGHHDAGRHLGIDERRRQDRDLARKRVGHGPVHERGAGNLFEDADLMVLECELLGRLPRDEPDLAIDLGPDVRHVRVYPEIGDAVHRLGPEGRGRHKGVVEPEHHEHEPDHLGLVALEEVVVADRVVAERAVPGRDVPRGPRSPSRTAGRTATR